MSDPRTIEIVLGAAPGGRLDKALAAAVPEGLDLSRSRIRTLIEAGAVTREGRAVMDPAAKPVPGDRIVIRLPEASSVEDAPEAIPLAVIHEDEHILVIDKPAGLVVHPAPGAESGTLVNALLHRYGAAIASVGDARRPGIVHRIDKDTSGLLVVARTAEAYTALSAAFRAHEVDREYLAVVWGVPDAAEPRLAGLPGIAWEAGGTLRIEGAIGRHPVDRKRMAVVASGGRHAVTRVRVLRRFGSIAALVSCRLETGRTHQIRVHLAHIGHSLVGDPVYARRRSLPSGTPPEIVAALREFPRQALHATRLGFRHPATGVAMAWETPLPRDLTRLSSVLNNNSPQTEL